MPKWFARVFTIVMVLACVATAWYAYQHEKLNFALEDVRVSLETSRARERKQQYEYDQVAEALPKAREELDEIQPKADAAKAEENALRETRKSLRAVQGELTDTLEVTDGRVRIAGEALAANYDTFSEVSAGVESGMTDALSELLSAMSGTRSTVAVPEEEKTEEDTQLPADAEEIAAEDAAAPEASDTAEETSAPATPSDLEASTQEGGDRLE